jgi:long-chain acyl-CoA synthetase
VHTSPNSIVTLSDACRSQALRCGTHDAFIAAGEATSFQLMERRSNRVANGLRGLDILPGDRVVVIAKDSEANYELLFGCAKCMAVLVPLNWRLSAKELAFIVADSKAKVLFVSAEYVEKLEEIKKTSSHLKDIIFLKSKDSADSYCGWRDAQSDALELSGQDRDASVVQIYTSGTTGNPKGVVLAHRTFFDLLEGMKAIGDQWMGLSSQDCLLLSLPQFHIGGMWWAIQGFLAGATGILMEQFVGWQALELIEKHQITKVAMVPAMIQFALSEPDANTRDLSSVTGFLYGGSPINVGLLRRAMSVFQCPFFQIYGLTETGNMAVCLRPEDHKDTALASAAGKALPGVDLKITDSEGKNVQTGEIGEIWIKSPSTMLGYWNNANATKDVLLDGWVKTGDAGYLNNKGYLFVCDRIKDMVIYAGENIYPAEIESVLSAHSTIAQCAVIGVPHSAGGEVLKAFVVAKSGCEIPKTRELSTHCRKFLADFKVPKSFEFVETLPRNPSGKVLKHVLREPFWKNSQRQVN